jgi:uncharacterized Zn-binding protein involved in type VI secretion
MPPAACISDMHVCPKVKAGAGTSRVGGPTSSGEPTLLSGYVAAARVGDASYASGGWPPDSNSIHPLIRAAQGACSGNGAACSSLPAVTSVA